MAWWDSFFGGFGNSASAADAMMGGTTDLGSLAASTPDFASNAGDWAGATGGMNVGSDRGSGSQGSDWSGTMGFGGADTGSSVFQPSSVGPPPAGGPFDTSNQGSSVVGSLGAGAENVTSSPVDDAPATAWESKRGNWYSAPTSRADVLRSGGDSLAYSSTPGMTSRVDPTASVASSSGPNPSFGDKLGAWAGKTGASLAAAPGRAADTFAREPIGTSANIASTVAPLVIAGINASQQADQARRAERQYQRSLPAPIPIKPLPGTTGIGRADLPAGSPMSSLMGARSGGFQVRPNVGLPAQPQPQRLATGGVVGAGEYGLGLNAGGPVGIAPAASPSASAQAVAILDYLDRLTRAGR